MRNTIVLSTVLFFAIIAASIYYFNSLDNKQQSIKSLRLLPENTLLVAAIPNQHKSSELVNDFEILDAVIGFDNSELWSTFRTKFLNNPTLAKHNADNTIYISFHPENKQIATLFTISITEDTPTTILTNSLKEINKSYKTSVLDTLGQKVYQIHFGQKDSILYTVNFQNNLLASTSFSLINKVTEKHSKHLPVEQVDYFLKQSSNKSNISIYFPHQQYDTIINLSQQSKKGPFIDLFKKLHGQSVWNINSTQESLILTGESQIDQYPENYISIFKNQEKQAQTLFNLFPSNTAIYAEFSISNRSIFQKDLENLFKRRKEAASKTQDTSSASSLLNESLGNQFALVETTAQNYLGFIKIKDSAAFQNYTIGSLEEASDSIGRFGETNILYKQYGDVFKVFPKPFFTIIDSVLVVANQPATLRDYRKKLLDNDLLIGTLGFIQLGKVQGNEANVSIFIHAKNANYKLTQSLTKIFKEPFKNEKKYGYQNFFSWSIQLSGNKDNMTSQIYAIYKSKKTLGIEPEWSFKMENKAITQPFVFEFSDSSDFIIIQELDHTIHALRPTGEKIWSKVFAGRVVGEIQQLEDRSIILLTDKNILYRVGTDGVPFRGFPKTLKTKPTGSPLICNINEKETMIIPTEKELLAYDLAGNTLQNWNFNSTNGKISSNILKNNSNFIFGTSTGHINWLDKGGNKVSEIDLRKSISTLGAVSDNELLALDVDGGVYMIVNNLVQQKWQINADSTNYYTAIPTPISSSNKRFVSINNNKLDILAVKDTLNLLFEHIFTKPITNQVQFFNNPENKSFPLIGISSRATNLVYLFDETGQIINGFPVEGQPLFYYGKISNSTQPYLFIMRRDNKLYAFKQQN